MNKVFLIGRTTKEVEYTTTPSGVAVSRFSLAVDRGYKDANGDKQTDFFNVVAWRGLADTCQKYMPKGKQVCIVGQIQNRTYEDNNGVKKYVTEIVAENIELLGGANNQNQEQTPAKPRPKADQLEEIDEDLLPF